jgi:hypothetical protein
MQDKQDYLERILTSRVYDVAVETRWKQQTISAAAPATPFC